MVAHRYILDAQTQADKLDWQVKLGGRTTRKYVLAILTDTCSLGIACTQ
jgi:hypothetical protein